MNWRNVKLVAMREIRDQLRDRRTLFMIAVLPVLLYPMVGMTFIQLKQFMREHKTRVLVIGQEELVGMDKLPQLFKDGAFAPELGGRSQLGKNVELVFAEADVKTTKGTNGSKNLSDKELLAARLAEGKRQLDNGSYTAVLVFPPKFGEELSTLHQSILDKQSSKELERSEKNKTRGAPDNKPKVRKNDSVSKAENDNAKSLPDAVSNESKSPTNSVSGIAAKPQSNPPPSPKILYNDSKEQSKLAYERVRAILRYWQYAIGNKNLEDSDLPPSAIKPIEIEQVNVAERGETRQAPIWAKILPFIVFIWALTGAFYPAVDLCAGEKERGTLETLLSSPASRAEIVWGKLLTVMLFSIATAILNLVSLGATGKFVLSQFQQMPGMPENFALAGPPAIAFLWLFIALIPIAALFSALCLALAAFAKSTREGQYYLMPVLLITAPLMSTAIWPGVELDLGKSLVPVAGLALLLRTLIDGNYAQAMPYVIPVLGVTGICCLLAIRWAVDQFQKEAVLFSDSERLDLRRWAIHLVKDRDETPSFMAAFACIAVLFLVRFFLSFPMGNAPHGTFWQVALIMFVSSVVMILVPTILMTLLFTRKRKKTLLLDRLPKLASLPMAFFLAVFIHPVSVQLLNAISKIYPASKDASQLEAFLKILFDKSYVIWLPLLFIAVLPAISEEIAFRGFILSGFRKSKRKWLAIGLSAFFFGMAHTVIQQSINAAILGLLIGYIAYQTGSLLPGIVFHITHNAIPVLLQRYGDYLDIGYKRYAIVRAIFRDPATASGKESPYQPLFVVGMGLVAAAIVYWFSRQQPKTDTSEYSATNERTSNTVSEHRETNDVFHRDTE